MSLITDALREAQREETFRRADAPKAPSTSLRGSPGVKLDLALRSNDDTRCRRSDESVTRHRLREMIAVVLAIAALGSVVAVAVRGSQPQTAKAMEPNPVASGATEADTVSEVIPIESAVVHQPIDLVVSEEPSVELATPADEALADPKSEPIQLVDAVNAGRFQLSGLIRAEGRQVAVINGAVMRVGDTIQGARVVRIDSFGVVLETNAGVIHLSLSTPPDDR